MVALEVFRAQGIPGLVFYRLTDRVAPALASYAPTPETLAKALRLVNTRTTRLRAAASALSALSALEAALLALR